MAKKVKITGEELAALLHHIHTHGDLIRRQDNKKIYYSEDDLLPILKAAGLPLPKWTESYSLKEWKRRKRKNIKLPSLKGVEYNSLEQWKKRKK